MKEQIIYAEYDKATGTSRMKKSNKYGIFCAEAHVHPEDKNIENRWDGLRFCEYKIEIKTAKVRSRILRERANGLKTAIMNIVPPDPDEEDYTWDKLVVQYMDAQARAADAEDAYRRLKRDYYDFVDACLEERKRIRKRAEK